MVDGKLSSVRIDAMRQMQVVVAAPTMGERWAPTAASLPIISEALVRRRVGSMIACGSWFYLGSVSKSERDRCGEIACLG